MKRNLIFAISLAAGMFSCNRQDELAPKTTQEFYLNSTTPGTLGRVGSATDVTRTTSGGTMLMGGGTDVDAAMRWMITKAGGGDIVVLRATGTNAYNNYIYGLQTCNSVETLLINSTTLANDPAVEAKIMAAEAVFITGGNQANYVNFWKNTRVENALNYLRNTKKCVIGGTSAGCAIQGRHYYAALNGSVLSADALANPYNVDMTLGANDFLENPYLDNLITDTHFNNPVRKGRLLAFMARMNKDYGVIARGVGVEEGTAVCIEEDGTSKVFGSANAFFYRQYNLGGPETCVSGSPLTWNRTNKAVLSYRVAGTTNGTNGFNFNTFQPIGSSTFTYVWANAGTFGESAATTPPADANSGGVNTATAPSALAYSPNSLSVQAGASATSALPTIQGTTPITFSRTVSPAAAGITINANDGRISVSSSVAAGTYSVSVTATNSAGTVTFNNVYTVNVTSTPPPSGGTTPGSLGRVGSNTDVSPATTGGTLIMGGGTDVDAAMRWMITKAGGGDIVVLRASGTNAYNNYIYGLQT
jgi:cyanophycinase-like exopeptidase